jgi:hypothetical protein
VHQLAKAPENIARPEGVGLQGRKFTFSARCLLRQKQAFVPETRKLGGKAGRRRALGNYAYDVVSLAFQLLLGCPRCPRQQLQESFNPYLARR